MSAPRLFQLLYIQLQSIFIHKKQLFFSRQEYRLKRKINKHLVLQTTLVIFLRNKNGRFSKKKRNWMLNKNLHCFIFWNTALFVKENVPERFDILYRPFNLLYFQKRQCSILTSYPV